MEHYYCPTTRVCLRCFITREEAGVFDPPSMCGEVMPADDVAETRKKKLVAEGLYSPPPGDRSPKE